MKVDGTIESWEDENSVQNVAIQREGENPLHKLDPIFT